MPESVQETLLAEISKEADITYIRQGFLTDSDVKSVWSKERYDQILSLNTIGFPDNFSGDKVSFLTMRSKILLILVEMRWSKWDNCYRSLKDKNCTDEALPFVKDDLKFLGDSNDVVRFQERQWRFNPPKLKEHGEIRKYDPGTILPFIKSRKETIGDGVTRESIPVGYWEYRSGYFNTVRICSSLILEVVCLTQVRKPKWWLGSCSWLLYRR